jgi:cytochrome c
MRFILLFLFLTLPAFAQMHGGPVRVLAHHKGILASGSFDQSIILWDKPSQTLRGHEGSVTALLSNDEQLISAGEDGRVIWWQDGKALKAVKKHEAQISALAQHGDIIASSSWDGSIALHGASNIHIKTASEKLIGVAFKQNGDLVSVSSDGDIYHISSKTGVMIEHRKSGQLITSMLLLKDDQLILGLSSGVVKIGNAPDILVADAPVIALAVNESQTRLAVATIGGTVTLYDLATRKMLYSLSGPGLPVFSLRLTEDEIITGGVDRLIRYWDIKNGESKNPLISEKAPLDLVSYQNDRGAEVFRACAICHSLTEDGDNKAGPSLYKIIDAKVASKVKYNYSEVLLKNTTVWTENNIKKLFEIGPNSFFPGTKMPEQRIILESDRQALVEFLRKTTQ